MTEFQLGDLVEVHEGFYGSSWQGEVVFRNIHIDTYGQTITYDVQDVTGKIKNGYNGWELTLVKKLEVIKCDFGCASVNATLHHYECSVRKHEEDRK